jgi:hypothetical protein
MLTRLLSLVTVLLLSGCLEAIDLVQERVEAPPVCRTPNGVAVCPGYLHTHPN